MVLGLRLPGAGAAFRQMLAGTCRQLAPGDVVVLTDGITERWTHRVSSSATRHSRVLAANQSLDAAGIRERVLREVRASSATPSRTTT
jgi:hypothetical protein